MPTVEEMAHGFSLSKFFSKLDARYGYCSIALDKESSFLRTFNSPFGRYSYLRIPFGLVCSQDVFQNRMDHVLEHCKGYISIADDITARGKIAEDHDASLRKLVKTAVKWLLVFNPKKTAVKARQVR